jgi:copper oxidase (laccase) domain-containing protein
LRQVHGAVVRVVNEPGGETGRDGDALVTRVPDSLLVALSADCALVAFGSPEGVAAVAHAGWRGVKAGVIGNTVEEMRKLGARRVLAWRGACINPCCYEFDPVAIEEVSKDVGTDLAALTRAGTPALDLPLGVRVALEDARAELVGEEPSCTGCGGDDGEPGDWFSWRARQDSGRMLLGAWREA